MTIKLFKNRRLLYILIVFVAVMVLLYLGRGVFMSQGNNLNVNQGNGRGKDNLEGKNPVVTIIMEDGYNIKLELYPDKAPNTVKNFIDLIKKDYYNGVIFHRVIKGFMIQGGDPHGTGMGGPGYSIKGEFSQNGFENNLKHKRGVISMARSMNPDSAGSQFFIIHQDSPHLDGQYAAFGKVIEGLEVVDKIASVQTDGQDKPLTDQIMKELKVETFGVEYGEPEKL